MHQTICGGFIARRIESLEAQAGFQLPPPPHGLKFLEPETTNHSTHQELNYERQNEMEPGSGFRPGLQL
jgi:hypothetical protein